MKLSTNRPLRLYENEKHAGVHLPDDVVLDPCELLEAIDGLLTKGSGRLAFVLDEGRVGSGFVYLTRPMPLAEGVEAVTYGGVHRRSQFYEAADTGAALPLLFPKVALPNGKQHVQIDAVLYPAAGSSAFDYRGNGIKTPLSFCIDVYPFGRLTSRGAYVPDSSDGPFIRYTFMKQHGRFDRDYVPVPEGDGAGYGYPFVVAEEQLFPFLKEADISFQRLGMRQLHVEGPYDSINNPRSL